MRELHGENVVPGTESAKPRILVVDDDPSTVQVISKMLDRLGYAVAAVAGSGEEALRKAAEARPDLVLMDIVLSGAMDGTEAAVRMRQMHLPVIYLTGTADNNTLQRAKEAEPFGYLVKPVGTDELNSAITIGLHNARIRKEEYERVRSTGAALHSDVDAENNNVLPVELSSAAENLWQAAVNYFERWAAYDQSVRTAEKTAKCAELEEAARTLVALAEHELRHSTEVFRETVAEVPAGLPQQIPEAVHALWSASERYFRELAACDELTREFQQRKAQLQDVERACAVVRLAQDRLREAAINFRESVHLANWAAE